MGSGGTTTVLELDVAVEGKPGEGKGEGSTLEGAVLPLTASPFLVSFFFLRLVLDSFLSVLLLIAGAAAPGTVRALGLACKFAKLVVATLPLV